MIFAVDALDRAALLAFRGEATGDFGHVDHVRVARLYVQQLPLGAAIDRFSADLRAFTRAKDVESRFHVTTTVAFLLLIRAKLAGAGTDEPFDAFLARNPELASATCLRAFYSDEALRSELARREFVFPDRGAATGPACCGKLDVS